MIVADNSACHTPSTNSVMANPVLRASILVATACMSNATKVNFFGSSSSSLCLMPSTNMLIPTYSSNASEMYGINGFAASMYSTNVLTHSQPIIGINA